MPGTILFQRRMFWQSILSGASSSGCSGGCRITSLVSVLRTERLPASAAHRDPAAAGPYPLRTKHKSDPKTQLFMLDKTPYIMHIML